MHLDDPPLAILAMKDERSAYVGRAAAREGGPHLMRRPSDVALFEGRNRARIDVELADLADLFGQQRSSLSPAGDELRRIGSDEDRHVGLRKYLGEVWIGVREVMHKAEHKIADLAGWFHRPQLPIAIGKLVERLTRTCRLCSDRRRRDRR